MTRFVTLPLILLLTVGAFAATSFAEKPNAKIPPISELKNIKPQNSIFKAVTRKKPLKITSAKEAAKHFSKDELAKLKKQVDFTQQIVLVFAWRGSGRDRLSYGVAESYPEQVTFEHKRGRTRDLRSHTYVFVLRSNVKWTP